MQVFGALQTFPPQSPLGGALSGDGLPPGFGLPPGVDSSPLDGSAPGVGEPGVGESPADGGAAAGRVAPLSFHQMHCPFTQPHFVSAGSETGSTSQIVFTPASALQTSLLHPAA